MVCEKWFMTVKYWQISKKTEGSSFAIDPWAKAHGVSSLRRGLQLLMDKNKYYAGQLWVVWLEVHTPSCPAYYFQCFSGGRPGANTDRTQAFRLKNPLLWPHCLRKKTEFQGWLGAPCLWTLAMDTIIWLSIACKSMVIKMLPILDILEICFCADW